MTQSAEVDEASRCAMSTDAGDAGRCVSFEGGYTHSDARKRAGRHLCNAPRRARVTSLPSVRRVLFGPN